MDSSSIERHVLNAQNGSRKVLRMLRHVQLLKLEKFSPIYATGLLALSNSEIQRNLSIKSL